MIRRLLIVFILILAAASIQAQTVPSEVEAALNELNDYLDTSLTFDDLDSYDWLAEVYNDGSLGCPKPGEHYLTVISPGYQVLLTYAGDTYDFRVGENSQYARLCRINGQVPVETPAEVEAALNGLNDYLKLSLALDDLDNYDWLAEVYNDASMGCPKPGHGYGAVITPGYQVLLTYASDIYDFRVDSRTQSAVLCTINNEDPPPIEVPSVDVTWIAPSGDTVTIGNPTYQWNTVEGATEYELYIGPNKFFGTVPASVCIEGVCSVDATTQTNTLVGATAWLSTGDYEVYISADAGETWNGAFSFSVTTPTPTTPTFTPATGTPPTINWTLEGNAVHLAFFQFYIAPALEITNQTFFGWVSREDACGSWDSTTCSWTPPGITFETATRYSIYVQGWGAGGLTDWATTDMNVGGPPPAEPTNVSFGLQGFTPTVTWDDDPNTTSYNVAVLFPNGVVFVESFPKADADCDGSTCRFGIIPPSDVQVVPGEYRVYVQPVGPGGTASGGVGGLNLGWFEVIVFEL